MYSNKVWHKSKRERDLQSQQTFETGVQKWSFDYQIHYRLVICSWNTLDKFGFCAYLAKFNLDKFINGPSGCVNIEAWKIDKTTGYNFETMYT